MIDRDRLALSIENCDHMTLQSIVDTILSDISSQGYVIVPREPTEAMLDAYWRQTGESKEMRSRTHAYMNRYWSAMIHAFENGQG